MRQTSSDNSAPSGSDRILKPAAGGPALVGAVVPGIHYSAPSDCAQAVASIDRIQDYRGPVIQRMTSGTPVSSTPGRERQWKLLEAWRTGARDGSPSRRRGGNGQRQLLGTRSATDLPAAS